MKRDIILIGASAGGITAVASILSKMDARISAAIGVTLHRGAFLGALDDVLARTTKLAVSDAREGERVVKGRVFLAPADKHMLFEGDKIRLDRGPKQHHTRPAIDPMLRSAAEAFGERVVGVVLTGNLSDGVTGLIHVKNHGGLSIVQDPQEAMFPSMPASALRYDHVDAISGIERMAHILSKLAAGAPLAKAVLSAEREAV